MFVSDWYLPGKTAKNAMSEQEANPSPEQQTLTVQQAIDLGVGHHNAGRLAEAESIYQQILQDDPNQPVALHLLGVIAHQVGKNDVAEELITKALSIEPNYVEANSNLSLVYTNLGRPDKALECCQKALAVNPDFAEGYSNMGLALRALGRSDEAINKFHKAIDINPLYAVAHDNLGYTYLKCGRNDEASTHLHKALAITPNLCQANYHLGLLLKVQGRIDEAIEYLKRGDPNCTDNIGSAILLECYYRAQDYDGFAHQLEQISKNQGFNARAFSISAFVSHQLGVEYSYKYCENPIGLVTVYNPLEDGDITPDQITELNIAVEKNTNIEKASPGGISGGFMSIGNLFEDRAPILEVLENVIRRYIDIFFQQHNDNQSWIFRDWPAEYKLTGWYVRLQSGGEITAHIHESWISGSFYLQIPPKDGDEAGNIEFNLNGFDLPVIRDDFPRRVVTTQQGLLVLFPSSLPHRTFPFSDEQNRLCLSFNVEPV